MLSNAISFLRDHLFTMPVLAKFAVEMVMLVVIPRLSRRLLGSHSATPRFPRS